MGSSRPTLRRNYLWIFALLALSWNLEGLLASVAGARLQHLHRSRRRLGLVPGWIVFVVGVFLQRRHRDFCDRHRAFARSNRRSFAATSVFFAPAGDE